MVKVMAIEEELENLLRFARTLLDKASTQSHSGMKVAEGIEADNLDKIALQAEELGRVKRTRAAFLSVLKTGAVFTLFLSLVLQNNFILFLSTAILGSVALGVATYLERER